MKTLLFLPLMAFFLASCGSTVTSRIEKNPQIYQSLSSKHKKLVDQGRISRGMSKEAVFLSWGKPASTGQGENASGKFERWHYTRLEPIYNHHFYGSYGRRYYRRGYGCYRGGYGYYPGYSGGVHYVSRPSAKVDFRNNRVTDWQRGARRGSGTVYP